ncbi:MAG: hypothetical protein SWH61_16620 [Thermodesulfobacteriota bacterium]|nr:hypothetical protein [Thermodesulfobacteriota bacterium]
MTQPEEKTQQYTAIRAQFDEVLARHLTRLIEVDFGDDSLSFDLATVTCLLLVVEQENAVRAGAEGNERFTKETFLEAVSELGLEVDDEVLRAFESLMQYGYVTLDGDQRYRAQIAAFALVDFFNNLFAGMPGLNLVSYVIQMIGEVLEDRKPLDTAVKSFDKTLHTKGVPLSRQKLDSNDKASVKESVKRRKHVSSISRAATAELRQVYLQKLSKLRQTAARSRSGEPAVFMKGSDGTGRVTVRDVFPKSDNGAGVEAGEEKAAQTPSPDMAHDDKQEDPDRAAEAEAAVQSLSGDASSEKTGMAMAADNVPDKGKGAPNVKDAGGDSKETDTAPQLSVEDRIQAFEESLAMTCPVCQTGKIKTETTEKDVPYYSCTNKHCGFISWGKPVAFACPACSNPFLIEFDGVDGESGLKCPRAACSYSQNSLRPPSGIQQAETANSQPQQKRKKLVRVRRKK